MAREPAANAAVAQVATDEVVATAPQPEMVVPSEVKLTIPPLGVPYVEETVAVKVVDPV
jgi:hypothetical protein